MQRDSFLSKLALHFKVCGNNYKINLPNNNSFTWFIAGDWHGEHLHIPTFTKLIQLAQAKKECERGLIINGDLFDAPYGFAKDEGYRKWRKITGSADEFFIPHFDAEVKLINDILDAVQSIFPEVWIVGGNHDEPRMENIKKIVPIAYRGYFNIKEKLWLDKRGINFVPYNDWLDIGNNFYSITHGMFHGAMAHKRHYMVNPRNLIFSHIHSHWSIPFQSRGQTKRVTSTPAMCDLNPEYMKNAESNWENGFLTLTLTPDKREHSLLPIIIKNDKMVMLDGRVI